MPSSREGANARLFHGLLEPEFGRELRVLGAGDFAESVLLARFVLGSRKAIVALVVGTWSAERQKIRERYCARCLGGSRRRRS